MEREINCEIFDISGLKLFVNKNFRFGTDAVLLSKFVKFLPKHTICDLCTGCGIIPFMIYSSSTHKPKKIYALDIAAEACGLLQQSAEINNIQSRIIPINEDLKHITRIPRESVDIITVNPPYFKDGSGKQRESFSQAAARHELMCSLDDVTRAAAGLLKYGGRLFMCHIPSRLSDVIVAMRNHNIEPKKLVFVSKRGSNKPWLILISGKKGANPGLIIEYTNTEEAVLS